jgi:hypothetical protein
MLNKLGNEKRNRYLNKVNPTPRAMLLEMFTSDKRMSFIDFCYAEGCKAYDNDPTARKEIQAINNSIYRYLLKKQESL